MSQTTNPVKDRLTCVSHPFTLLLAGFTVAGLVRPKGSVPLTTVQKQF
jgi:hypothetical protein